MLVTAIAMLLQTTAVAPATPPAPQQTVTVKGRRGYDPNRVVCVEQQVTGSRLGGQRICRTAADWAQDQRDARMNTEQGQAQAKMPGQTG